MMEVDENVDIDVVAAAAAAGDNQQQPQSSNAAAAPQQQQQQQQRRSSSASDDDNDTLTKHSLTDLNNWGMFGHSDAKVRAQIRSVCVFGEKGSEVVFVTSADSVFAFGTNKHGCLGVGDQEPTFQPKPVAQLSKKSVVKCAIGEGPHVLALTRAGQLFSWGHGGYGQLGHGTIADMNAPTLVNGPLNGKRVVDIACGAYYSLAVVEGGIVYAWGYAISGQLGFDVHINVNTPALLTHLFDAPVSSVACCFSSSYALTRSGSIYAWGQNYEGQLGVGESGTVRDHAFRPMKVVRLDRVLVRQLVCGFHHCLALSDQGEVYGWGKNHCGQLGNGRTDNVTHPVRVIQQIGRVVELAASNNISAALTRGGCVYVWGQCGGMSVVEPVLTSVASLHDAFACYCQPRVTHGLAAVQGGGGGVATSALQQSLRNAFDDQTSSDVKFMVDGKLIHAHKSILKIRSTYLNNMFQDHWRESSQDVIEVNQFSYSVYRAFLGYMYSDDVQLQSEVELIQLLDLSKSFCEDRLQSRCEQLIKQSITVDNAVSLYEASVRHRAVDLEEFCLNFIVNHSTAVTQSAAFATVTDPELLTALITEISRRGAFRS